MNMFICFDDKCSATLMFHVKPYAQTLIHENVACISTSPQEDAISRQLRYELLTELHEHPKQWHIEIQFTILFDKWHDIIYLCGYKPYEIYSWGMFPKMQKTVHRWVKISSYIDTIYYNDQQCVGLFYRTTKLHVHAVYIMWRAVIALVNKYIV